MGVNPPNPEDDPRRAVAEFLLRLRADEASAGPRPLREYLAEFAAHEELIAREYLQVRALDRRAGELAQSTRDFAQFRLLEELGSGGEGTVFLAHEPQLDREVALKILRQPPGELEEARFLRAASLAARVDHANLCRVYDAGRSGCALWVSMQHIEGRSLARDLESRRRREEPFTEGAAATLVAQVLRGLQHAHEHRVVHRDAKPGNILLRAGGAPVLVDFGLARDLGGAGELSSTGELRGTFSYMAPEQIEGGPVSPAVDIWACGAVLFECVTLARPFTGSTTPALAQHICQGAIWEHDAWRQLSSDLQAVLATALHKDPGGRYQSAAAFADDLQRLARGEPVSVRVPGPLRRAHAWARREPALATGLAAAAFGLLAGLLAVTWWWQRERSLRADAEAVAARTRATAKAMLFDINDALASGREQVAVRRRLVAQARDSLAALAADAPDDLQLRRELALAFMRLGDLEGHDSVANLAEGAAADRCFARAEELARQSIGADPRAPTLLAAVLLKRADLRTDRPDRAAATCREALRLLQGDGAQERRLRGVAGTRLAILERDAGRHAAAQGLLRQAEADFGAEVSPADRAVLRDAQATVLASTGEVTEAVALLRGELARLRADEEPHRRLRGTLLLHLAQCQAMAGAEAAALARLRELEQLWRGYLATHPGDAGAALRLVHCLEERARLLHELRRDADAVDDLHRALELARRTGHRPTADRLERQLAARTGSPATLLPAGARPPAASGSRQRSR